jgi:nucleoside-diphosphate-sugar epimerase
MPTALITGAAGFIGFFAAQRLLKDGYCVVGLDCMSDYYHVSLKVVLSRFSSGLFRAMFAMNEIWHGKEIHRRVSA